MFKRKARMQMSVLAAAVLAVALAALVAPHHAGAQTPPTGLPAPVAQALAQAGIPDASTAVYVHEIGAERPLVAHGAERALNPASTMKLVTTYAALDLLGPAYMWNTEIFGTGVLSQDVLNGDLVIKGYGDPKLTLEHFWLLLRGLRARGVREIRGDLVLDRGYFAPEEFDAARFDDQPTRPYNTGPNALLVNYKAIRVQFIPDPETRTVRLAVEPQLPQVQIVNNLTLDNAPCGDWVARLKLDTQGNSNNARLAFNGSFAQGCGERVRHFSVLGHQQYTLGLFTQLWRELGGSFAGTVREGETPPGARLLASAQSQTLSEIVRDINKFSNNVMARQLFLTLGAASAGAPATPEKSNTVIKQWVNSKGVSIPELVLENGSGLSRIERISARNLGLLLINAFRSPVMPELMASLPLTAVDGTMRKRLANAEVAGQAHIKTGSLSGVRAIAGYVLDAQGRRVAVVFIANHANAHNAQPVQDALLKWVYSRSGDECCRQRRK
jgi:D-alanyl-D-alanine carboxypeptidase/D-alanyl-D-alanine-endopeptidase (penicillin-binding protein 4)